MQRQALYVQFRFLLFITSHALFTLAFIYLLATGMSHLVLLAKQWLRPEALRLTAVRPAGITELTRSPREPYHLRVVDPNQVPFGYQDSVPGEVVQMQCIRVGLVYFDATQRPSFFASDRPKGHQYNSGSDYACSSGRLPIVLDSKSIRYPREIPHCVYAAFVRHIDGSIGCTKNGFPILYLYTNATDENGRLFEPWTHALGFGRNCIQYAGVEIRDWSMVTFDAYWMRRLEGRSMEDCIE